MVLQYCRGNDGLYQAEATCWGECDAMMYMQWPVVSCGVVPCSEGTAAVPKCDCVPVLRHHVWLYVSLHVVCTIADVPYQRLGTGASKLWLCSLRSSRHTAQGGWSACACKLEQENGVLQRESFLLHMLFVGALSMPGLRQQHCKAFVCGALRALMRILVGLQDVGGACVCLHVCYVLYCMSLLAVHAAVCYVPT